MTPECVFLSLHACARRYLDFDYDEMMRLMLGVT